MSRLVVRPNGTIEFIYADELRGLLDLGMPSVKRVSHVEPVEWDENSIAWIADMTPVKESVILGPFNTRAEALAEEVKWLEQNIL